MGAGGQSHQHKSCKCEFVKGHIRHSTRQVRGRASLRQRKALELAVGGILIQVSQQVGVLGDGRTQLRERLAAMWQGDEKHNAATDNQLGTMELMSQSPDTVHSAMSRLQLAQDPPDMLIQIPRESCSFHEYWRAKEMIEIGHRITMTALTRMPY